MKQDAAYEAVMVAYQEAQVHGGLARVLDRIWEVLSSYEWDDVRLIELNIAAASLEDELGLGGACRERLQKLKPLAANTTRLHRHRIAYYLITSLVRDEDAVAARRELEYFEAQGETDHGEIGVLYWFCSALVEESAGRLEEAVAAYRRAHRLTEVCDDPARMVSCVVGVARILLRRGEFVLAHATIDGAPEQLDPYHAAYVGSARTFALAGVGELDSACDEGARVFEAATTHDLPTVGARTAALLAAVWHVRGRRDEARAWHTRAATLDAGGTASFDTLLRVIAAWLDNGLDDVGGDPAAAAVVRAMRDEKPCTYDDSFTAVLAALAAHGRKAVSLSRDGRQLSVHGVQHDLSRRGPMRRILLALVAAQADDAYLDTASLFAIGWPDVEHLTENGFRRVYTEIHRLRDVELEIASSDAGYLLVTRCEQL